MIEGLKVTIIGTELRELCIKQAEVHRKKSEAYQKQVDTLADAGIDGMANVSNDPKLSARDKVKEHAAKADELAFIASHIDLSEIYQLTRNDLVEVGVVRRGW